MLEDTYFLGNHHETLPAGDAISSSVNVGKPAQDVLNLSK
jgi:hypothetical protein